MSATAPPPSPQALPHLGLASLSIAGCAPFPAWVDGERRRMLPLSKWRDGTARRLHGSASLRALLDDWPTHERLLRDAGPTTAWAPIDGLRWHAPWAPRQVYCTIGNYRAQVLEAALDAEPPSPPQAVTARRQAVLAALDERRRTGAPYAVVKPNATVCGPCATVQVGHDEQTLDWEVEIGAVIGRTAWRVPPTEALRHVAAYCTVNDITLRQRLFRQDLPAMGTDFLQAKGGPGWLPTGPCLVPASHVPDPQGLRLQLRLNGQLMQDGCADDMVFSIAEQIAYLSRHVRLEPGDLVCTGSPAGFGQHHRRFLRPGDQLEAEVIGLGAQCNPIVTATTP